jgi:RNA polymerase I-specific transcription initiation factor RRN3
VDEEEAEGEDSRLDHAGEAVGADPFDLLISEALPLPPSASRQDDDDDDDSDPDIDDLSSADGDDSDNDTADIVRLEKEKEKKRAALLTMRSKLDGMLYWFYAHLDECMGDLRPGISAVDMAASSLTAASSGTSTPTSEIQQPSLTPRRPPPTPAQSLAHFQTLLNVFSRQILPTSATSHIPFLMFLCCSFAPAHTELFLGLLVSQALYATSANGGPNSTAQPVSLNQRISATVYIGSVVCRGKFVTDDQARTVTTYLLAYIDGKLHQPHSKGRTDELPLFYAVCQATMLIFCFRWGAFLAKGEGEGDGVLGDLDMEGLESEDGMAEEGSKWIKDLDVLQKALTSDLNPLLVSGRPIIGTIP